MGEFSVKVHGPNMIFKKAFLVGLFCLIVGIGALLWANSNISEYKEKSKTFIDLNAQVVSYRSGSEGKQAIIF